MAGLAWAGRPGKVYWAAAMAFAPAHTCIAHGQTGIVAVALVALGSASLARRGDRARGGPLPGALLGLGAAIKPQVAALFSVYQAGRGRWQAVIASIAVPISLIGTFGLMYLLGYSLNNLSLMALTIATGFVVDDAIVMIENISRHLQMRRNVSAQANAGEAGVRDAPASGRSQNISRYIEEGETPMAAALKGATQIGFTIISLTVSLIAVLIPLLFMGDVVGRLFHEFAITLAVAILISAFVSLTLTPMMSARLLKPETEQKHSRLGSWFGEKFEAMSAMSGETRAHEEFRMQLEKAHVETVKGIDAQTSIAREQAEVLGTALSNAKIDIVGGQGDYFDRFVGALAVGKGIDGVVNKSKTLQVAFKDQLAGERDPGGLPPAGQKMFAQLDEIFGTRRRIATPVTGKQRASALGYRLQQFPEKRGVHLGPMLCPLDDRATMWQFRERSTR